MSQTVVGAAIRRIALGALLLCLAATPILAQPAGDARTGKVAQSGILSMLPADATSEHKIDTSAGPLAYTATAGTLSLFDQDGERSAAIFYTAYRRSGGGDAARPLTFVFNGGPGAASAYLHLGLAGPQVVAFGAERDGASARLVANPDTWLQFTDLVMLDPVGTGWSHAAKSGKDNDFWNVRTDAQSLAKAIALYVAKNDRGASPTYLLGESYGGFRAAKVAAALQREQGLFVTGIVMVSPLLEAPLIFGGTRYPLGAALQLPSFAAAELDRRGAWSADAQAAAERFAMNEYLTTLAGRPPEGEAARDFYARLAALTGVPTDTVTRTRGFLRDAIVKHAAGPGRIAGSYDASETFPDPYPEAADAEGPDPTLDGYTAALGGLMARYARDELGFVTEMTYRLLNRDVAGKWDWGKGGRTQASVSGDLRELLALNPRLSILVAHGRSDIVTPYMVSRYVRDHLPAFAAGRTALRVYKGGHMFYTAPAERAAFTADIGAFYRKPGL